MRAVQQRQNEESCRRSAKDKQQESKVKLFCKKCSEFACSGDYIRCIKEAHHVVIDKDFLSKFSFKRNKCPQSINGIELTGRFLLIRLNFCMAWKWLDLVDSLPRRWDSISLGSQTYWYFHSRYRLLVVSNFSEKQTRERNTGTRARAENTGTRNTGTRAKAES